MVAVSGPAYTTPGNPQATSNAADQSPVDQFLNSDLAGTLSKLFSGQQNLGGDPQTKALLNEIRALLSQLLQRQGGCGGGHGQTCGDDKMHGGRGHDHLDGGRGNDEMYGRRGHDHLDGGCGDDKMYGGRGRDRLDGGRGDDEMYGGRGHDHLDGGCGDDKMRGGRGRDHLDGGCGDDKMYGGRGRDHLDGGCGDDKMHGGRGHDHLDGGCGDDDMKGGRGHDHLHGGAGHNRMDGGRGNDTYVIEAGSDNVITDGKGRDDNVKFDGCECEYDMERQGDDLIVTHKEDGTRVVIKDQFAKKGGVDTLEFDDGKFDDFESIEECGHGHVHRDDPRPDLPGYDLRPMPMPHYIDLDGGEGGGEAPDGDCGEDGDAGHGCSG